MTIPLIFIKRSLMTGTSMEIGIEPPSRCSSATRFNNSKEYRDETSHHQSVPICHRIGDR